MKVRALYIALPGSDPVDCYVRVHSKFNAIGGLIASSDFAEREEVEPKILFMRSEIPVPARNAVISISTDEAYRLAVVSEPDGLTITATATRLLGSELAGLPVPEGA
ncbi:hypothetical protein [Hartmannibacter diazotrophicus]|uniref:hypothetical protein n=1 Tax=Hartmannibacter diazotrophicus TaxID=1482074 RepID=UPI000C15E7C0|nr:hypothetical protein [Hartmannibacter diazotrophicus]